MAIQVARRRFTVEDYHRMAETGILCRADRVELIDGEVVEMSPIGPGHGFWVAVLVRRLVGDLPERAVVWIQTSIRLDWHHEPEPDLAVLRPPATRYRSRLPGPEDILLLIEVADTSLAYDREVKLPLYARLGIPEVWIADVEGETVEVYRVPAPGGYPAVARVGRGGLLIPQAFPDIALAVDDLLD